MAIPFSSIVTPSSIIFTALSGKTINVTSAHINFENIKKLIKQIQMLATTPVQDHIAGEDIEFFRFKLEKLTDIQKSIKAASKGLVEVVDGQVKYDNEVLHGAIAERILNSLAEGFSADAYMRFIENLMKNPSKRAVDELYRFVEKSTMGITDDGMIIAYKRVRGDYKDIHSGTCDNSVGTVLEMPRNKVDDNAQRTCSYGYHFCSFSYLCHFGSSGRGDRIMIVKVNPADVVSIPADYNDAKARCCRYEVIGEYEGDDKDDILASRSVWAGDSDWQRELPRSMHDYDDAFFNSVDDCDSSDGGYWLDGSDGDSDDDLDADASAPVSANQMEIDIIAARVKVGDTITEALYNYRPMGAFVKVVLTLNRSSFFTVYDENLLAKIDELIAHSNAAALERNMGVSTKIRMVIVP